MARRSQPIPRRTLLGGAAVVAGAALVPARRAVAAPHPTAAPPALGPLELYLLATPVRVLDTRQAGGALARGDVRDVDVTLTLQGFESGVPASTSGVLLNLTLVDTVSWGYVTVWAAGSPMPGTSSANFDHSGQTLANSVISLHTAGSVKVAVDGLVGCGSHLILDAIGFYDDTGA